MNPTKRNEHIIYNKTCHTNEPGYLDQLYLLRQRAAEGIPPYLITQRERRNYNRNCKYHRVQNVFNMPSLYGITTR